MSLTLFYLPASSLEVTTAEGPTGFHERLVGMIRRARERLSLASLYLGTGEREEALLGEVRGALERHPGLRVRFVCDASRGRRRTPNGDVVSFTAPLARAFPGRVEVYLHEMPQLAGWAKGLPSPLDECVAVFHFKALVADGEAILTGANLSDEYFHCRQCRAIVVRDVGFTDMLHRIVETTARHSRRAVDGALAPAERPPEEVAAAVLADVRDAPRAPDATGTWLRPVFQHPSLGVHQEQELLEELLATPGGDLEIHTPYTNFPQVYVRALERRMRADGGGVTRLVCPSGASHSFTTGRGPKALVPGAYRHQEARLVGRLRALGALDVRHYHRQGWVFHSKGVWWTEPGRTTSVIGSSSYGERSVGRDFDLSVEISTDDAALQEGLAEERELMMSFAPGEREVARPLRRLMPIVTPLFRGFL